jgi:hypothetical protein
VIACRCPGRWPSASRSRSIGHRRAGATQVGQDRRPGSCAAPRVRSAPTAPVTTAAATTVTSVDMVRTCGLDRFPDHAGSTLPRVLLPSADPIHIRSLIRRRRMSGHEGRMLARLGCAAYGDSPSDRYKKSLTANVRRHEGSKMILRHEVAHHLAAPSRTPKRGTPGGYPGG